MRPGKTESHFFRDGVKISSYSIQDGVLNVEFNEAYDKMSRTRELLVRAGIVKIFLQVPGVDSVEIYVGKKPADRYQR